jgi:ADP-ribose diphosphatase
MALKSWRTISESTVFKNPWWTYKRDDVEYASGRSGEYHYVHTNGSSMIVPLMPDGKVLMVKQYRYLCRRESLEFPCGGVKDESSYDETANHELAEETGFTAKQLLPAGEFNPYNGITDEMCRVYIARGLQHVGGTPDETEEFELLQMEPQDVEKAILDGKIWDGMSIAAWMIGKAAANQNLPA